MLTCEKGALIYLRASLNEFDEVSREGAPRAPAGSRDGKRTVDRPRRRRGRGEIQDQKTAVLSAAAALTPGFRKSDVMKHSGSSKDLGRCCRSWLRMGGFAEK